MQKQKISENCPQALTIIDEYTIVLQSIIMTIAFGREKCN